MAAETSSRLLCWGRESPQQESRCRWRLILVFAAPLRRGVQAEIPAEDTEGYSQQWERSEQQYQSEEEDHMLGSGCT